MPIGPITPGSYVIVTPDTGTLLRYDSIQAPTASMGVISADIQALTLYLLNVQNSIHLGSVSSTIELAGIAGASGPAVNFSGSKVYVYGFGWYSFSSTGGLPANDTVNFLVVDGIGGKWLRHDYLSASNKLTPIIGPSTAVSFPISTPVGRLNPSLIPFGFYVAANLPAGTDTSVDSTPVTPTAGQVIAGGLGTIAIGTLAVGDIVECQLSMIGFNTGGDFSFGAYISFDDGATYTCMSPNVGGGALTYQQTPSGTTRVVAVDFVKTATAAGVCKVQFKFGRVSAGTTNAWWGPGRLLVTRQ